MTFQTAPSFEDAVRDMQADTEAAHRLMEADPLLPFASALTIAMDRRRAERAWHDMTTNGIPYEQAIVWVGSFARFDFALRARKAGFLSTERLLADLPDLWRGSDPDDTDPRALAVWREAWLTNHRFYIRDGRPLPRGTKVFRVWRGQDEGAALGISWTLDPKVATKFARGAGTRQGNRPGHVYAADVPRDRIYAYLTKRGESEVIFDPTNLTPSKEAHLVPTR